MAITRNEYTHWRPEETKIINGNPVRFCDVCVHTIKMGDVDDPDLFVADPSWHWQQTESGKWVMENAVGQPYWIKNIDTLTYGYTYKVMARLSEQNQTFWELKWSGNN